MKQLRISNTFSAFPLVFFVLTGSPNLNGERIGITMLASVVLFLFSSYFIDKRWKIGRFGLFDVIILVLIAGCAYLGKSVSWEFAIMIIIWPILLVFKGNNGAAKFVIHLLQGIGLFCLLYFGINQYGFNSLIKPRVLWMLLTFMPIFLHLFMRFDLEEESPMRKDHGLSFFTAVVALGLYSWLMFDISYMLVLLAITAPSFYTLYRIIKIDAKEEQVAMVRLFRIFSILGLTIYNLYLFLDTTQVLQAVLGGY